MELLATISLNSNLASEAFFYMQVKSSPISEPSRFFEYGRGKKYLKPS